MAIPSQQWPNANVLNTTIKRWISTHCIRTRPNYPKRHALYVRHIKNCLRMEDNLSSKHTLVLCGSQEIRMHSLFSEVLIKSAPNHFLWANRHSSCGEITVSFTSLKKSNSYKCNKLYSCFCVISMEVVETMVLAHQHLPGNLCWKKQQPLIHSDTTAWANVGFWFQNYLNSDRSGLSLEELDYDVLCPIEQRRQRTTFSPVS